MTSSKQSYDPSSVFTVAGETPPRVLAAPQRYIQGPGVIDHIGQYVSLLKVARAGVLADSRGLATQGAQVAKSLEANNIEPVNTLFSGQCSLVEIEAQTAALEGQQLDCLVAVGGGSTLDAGKCIAYRLDIPLVVVSTLASNDAPCSALAVINACEGGSAGVEYFPQNPSLVVVDTDVVVQAGERFLVAGIGDALATWYEARACLNNPAARNMLGARTTLASCAMGEVCAQTLYEHGEAAVVSVRAGRNNEVVENVVEANTLLSGLGFESGGLAMAHAIQAGCSNVKVINDNYMHGEMVAMGLMVQLALEQADDRQKAARFLACVGLPVHLGQLSLSPDHHDELKAIVDFTMLKPIAHNMPMPFTQDSLLKAILDAHELGLQVTDELGDEAYRRLHG